MAKEQTKMEVYNSKFHIADRVLRLRRDYIEAKGIKPDVVNMTAAEYEQLYEELLQHSSSTTPVYTLKQVSEGVAVRLFGMRVVVTDIDVMRCYTNAKPHEYDTVWSGKWGKYELPDKLPEVHDSFKIKEDTTMYRDQTY